jgi:hypothetical protein
MNLLYLLIVFKSKERFSAMCYSREMRVRGVLPAQGAAWRA